MTSLVVLGAAGRMGRAVLETAAADPGFQLKACVDRAGKPAWGEGTWHSELEPVLAAGDVVIEFSDPTGAAAAAGLCAARGASLVSGTTGLSAAEEASIEAASKKVAVLRAANFSLGVLALKLAVRAALRPLTDWDVEIVERHHRAKKDSPSGTALALAAEVEAALGPAASSLRHGREGAVGPRPRGEVGMHSVRGGTWVGDHAVLVAGEGEWLELRHVAQDRAAFARGAVRAAGFVAKAPPGLYTLEAVLKSSTGEEVFAEHMFTKRQALASLAFATLIGLVALPAHAQSFGKNKVQYDPLHWAVLETPHARLHFYAEEESLSRRLAAFAESVCVEYDHRFRVEFRRPIPILLYSTHHLFQQTNATPGLISESVGGLTELIKGRVLIPHNGSWARLTWVTRHELAHAYMLEKLSRVMREHKRSRGYLPPLWFIEGLAEYCGTTWDADAEGLLRDAVLSNRALPLQHSEPITGTVLMYKEGQSFLLYLADRFGPDRVFDLMDAWWRADEFETAFKLVYGFPLEEVDRDWFAEIKRRYYPTVATLETASEQGQRLTRHGHYNLGPRVLPAAPGQADSLTRFCYFAAGEGGIELRVSEPAAKGRRHERRLLRSGLSPSFESFHLFQNRPDASPSGMVALSAKHGGRDALYIVNAASGTVARRLEFPHLVAILDPALVPGDQAVVFSAQEYSGRADLYRASWPEGRVRLERLTNDDFDDQEPDVSPDGRWVVFASDRVGRAGHYSLCRLSLATGAIEVVSWPTAGDDRQPVYSPDGRWIAFRSTRAGTSDLWLRGNEPAREARRVTRTTGPAMDPDWLAGGRGLLFTGQDRVEFQTYRVGFDPDTLKAEPEAPEVPPLAMLATDTSPTRPVPADPVIYDGPKRPYERRLGLDLIQNAIGVDPALGGAGGQGQLAISDILGDEQLYLSIANDSERFGGDFWDGFEGGLTYINQGRRLNYGLGIFRLTEVYDADLDVVRRERREGVLGLAMYPFSKFNRVEGSILVRHASDHRLRNGAFQDVDLVSQYLSFVHDNAGWGPLGPSSGSRWLLSAGFTRDMTSGAGDFANVLGEFRYYQQPIPVVVSATRFQGQSSFGHDAQLFYLGGRTALRGYDRRVLSGLQTVLVQQEFRIPVVRGLTFAVPTVWEFPAITAAVFADAAWAWTPARTVPANASDGTLDFLIQEEAQSTHLGSAGTGLYIGGGYYPAIRWNFVWTTADFKTFSTRPRTQFLIGFNF